MILVDCPHCRDPVKVPCDESKEKWVKVIARVKELRDAYYHDDNTDYTYDMLTDYHLRLFDDVTELYDDKKCPNCMKVEIPWATQLCDECMVKGRIPKLREVK